MQGVIPAGNPKAQYYRHLLSLIDKAVPLKRGPYPFWNHTSMSERRVAQRNQEFIPTEAAYTIPVPDDALRNPCSLFEHHISGGMTVSVVDRFAIVQNRNLTL